MRFSTNIAPLRVDGSVATIAPRLFPGQTGALLVTANPTTGGTLQATAVLERWDGSSWVLVDTVVGLPVTATAGTDNILIDETLYTRVMVDNDLFRWEVTITDDIDPLGPFYTYVLVDLVPHEQYTSVLGAKIVGCDDRLGPPKLSAVQGSQITVRAELYDEDGNPMENLSLVVAGELSFWNQAFNEKQFSIDQTAMIFDDPSLGYVTFTIDESYTTGVPTGIYNVYLELVWFDGHRLEWPQLFRLNVIRERVDL